MKFSDSSDGRFLMMRPCGRQLFELIPKNDMSICLETASEGLAGMGYEIVEYSELILSIRKDYDVSIYPSGKMIVFPVESNEEAERVGSSVFSSLEKIEGCIIQETPC